jgi:alcohol dehydrogenase class IV
VLLIGVGAVLCSAAVPTTSHSRPVDPAATGGFQELLGARIQALGRFDVQRHRALRERGEAVIRALGAIDDGRHARLQEFLGQSIAHTGSALDRERTTLTTALAESRAVQRNIRSGGWFQERVGSAIAQTAGLLHPDDPRFAEQVRARLKVLSAMEFRMANRADVQVEALAARLTQFSQDAFARLGEAVQDAHRAARLYEASHKAWVARPLPDIQAGLAFSRSVEDYRRVVDAVTASLRPFWGVGGFWEFGAASILGICAAMAWVGATAPREVPRPGAWPVQAGVGVPGRYQPYQWKREASMTQSTTLFSWPREVMFGSHCSREIGRHAARDHIKQAMILTDSGVAQKGLVDLVKASLLEAGLRCEVIDEVSREVPHGVVADIADRCKHAGTELLVAVGGGSVIDTAKAVGILLANGGTIQDYEGVDRVGRAIMPLYVVPTTSGCGSETSQFCVVLDTKRKKKIEILSRKLLPERIFIDPMMTRSMPPDLTASSGMEALSNAVEAYFSTWASPLTDTLSLSAIRLISEHLRAAVANGQNLEARQQLSLAAFQAGLAFTNAQSGAVHALGHSLSGMFDIPQRISDAILLPHVMKANLNADIRRMAMVAETLGEPVAGLSARAAAQRAIDAVKVLLLDVGLPTDLVKVGADRTAIASLSEQAMQDSFLRTNPRMLNREDIEAIYEDAFAEYVEVPAGPGPWKTTVH